jgi:hypothetical protein
MVQETTATFREVLFKNLGLREFLDADWTMLNARLAEHYGIPGVEGDDFRRIALAPDLQRGGLLTQASILSLTSDGTRHRPVHRGVWVMDRRAPSPPPPANVPPSNRRRLSPKATLRTADPQAVRLRRHHRKIDPRFAFDATTRDPRWHSGSRPRRTATTRVDAGGGLPDGRKFADAAEFRSSLADVDKFNARSSKLAPTPGGA